MVCSLDNEEFPWFLGGLVECVGVVDLYEFIILPVDYQYWAGRYRPILSTGLYFSARILLSAR